MNTTCIIDKDCDLCYECVECCPGIALTTDCCGGIVYDCNACQYCEVCSDVCPKQCIHIIQLEEEAK